MAKESMKEMCIRDRSNGLAKLAEEDPTFTVKTDEQTGQTVISGISQAA